MDLFVDIIELLIILFIGWLARRARRQTATQPPKAQEATSPLPQEQLELERLELEELERLELEEALELEALDLDELEPEEEAPSTWTLPDYELPVQTAEPPPPPVPPRGAARGVVARGAAVLADDPRERLRRALILHTILTPPAVLRRMGPGVRWKGEGGFLGRRAA